MSDEKIASASDPSQKALHTCKVALSLGMLANPEGQKIVYREIARLERELARVQQVLKDKQKILGGTLSYDELMFLKSRVMVNWQDPHLCEQAAGEIITMRQRLAAANAKLKKLQKLAECVNHLGLLNSTTNERLDMEKLAGEVLERK